MPFLHRRTSGAILPPALLALVSVTAATLAPAEAHPDPVPVPSALQELPSANQNDLVRALRKARRKYGEDAIVIETHLLVHAMRSGSQRSTAVGIEGVKDYGGKRYLGFNVETGLVFDSMTRDLASRVAVVWMTILAPTLERLARLEVPADGIKVAMQYYHRPYRTQQELRATIDQLGTSEEASFYLLAGDVREVVGRRLTASKLLERARILIDGTERSVEVPDLGITLSPGPD